MKLSLVDWLIIAAYLALSLAIGLYYVKRAGRSTVEASETPGDREVRTGRRQMTAALPMLLAQYSGRLSPEHRPQGFAT